MAMVGIKILMLISLTMVGTSQPGPPNPPKSRPNRHLKNLKHL